MKDCVLGIIFNRDKSQVLLTKRRDIPIWVLPGGGIEKGETCEEAAIREIFEETGLKVSIRKKIGHYYPINRLAQVTHLFECQTISGDPRLSTETKEISYFPINCLPKTFFTLHDAWLNDALTESNHPVRKPIDQVTYAAILTYFFKHPIIVIRSLLARLGMPINS